MTSVDDERAVDIELPADAAFFALLSQEIAQIAQLEHRVSEDFMSNVNELARSVSLAARPTSQRGKSDLYAWREIFALWVETEVFESTSERARGDRPLAEAEDRLGDFAREVTKRGLGDARTLKRKESQAAVEQFLQLNLALLNLKKVRVRLVRDDTRVLTLPQVRTSERGRHAQDP